MKKNLFFLTLSLFVFISAASAQQGDSTISFRVLLKFQSECCGVPSDRPLIKAISSFKRKYHVRSIQAYRIGPMGREGEYYLGFYLKELNRPLRSKLISKMRASVILMCKDKGTVAMEENSKTTLPSIFEIKEIRF